jgi:hypothetical protein
LSHVEQNLSLYFSPNTHLTGEALALYVCGRALPELLPAASWEETGRSVLLAEIERQVAPDGGHVERSTHYQRYTLDFYVLALAMARATDDPCADRFADAVHRLASATRMYVDHEGRVPLIGDDDGGALFPICGRPPYDLRDSLASAAALLSRPEVSVDGTPEETMWLLGNQPSWIVQRKSASATSHVDPVRSAPMSDTGYFVSRPRPCDHLLFDCGPHGYLNGGHAHADALSLVATLDGRRLFVDPGTATYTMSSEVRDRFRDSRMHNTLTLDGRSQSVPAGPFHWKTVANGRMQRWITSPHLDYFEGVHDGYLPAIHRRRVVAAEVLWHLDPAWRLDGAARGAVSLRHASGDRAWLVSVGAQTDFMAGDEGGYGWMSPVYGRVEPSLALRLTARRTSPFAVVSMFGTGHLDEAPSVERMPVEHEVAGADVLALCIRSGFHTDIVVFGYREPLLPERAPGSEPSLGTTFPQTEDGKTVMRVGDIETDARLLCVQFDGDAEAPRVVVRDDGYARSVSTGRTLGG